MKYVVFSAKGVGGVPDVKTTGLPTAPPWLLTSVICSRSTRKRAPVVVFVMLIVAPPERGWQA